MKKKPEKNPFTSNQQTELQRLKNKERQRIGHEKDRARRITQKLQEEKKRSSETEDHEKQCLATLKRMKRGDDNELERKLRLEKVVARLAAETEKKEEQDWRRW